MSMCTRAVNVAPEGLSTPSFRCHKFNDTNRISSGVSLIDDQTDHDQWSGGSTESRENNQEKSLPCRGCTRMCSRYGHCDRKLWRASEPG